MFAVSAAPIVEGGRDQAPVWRAFALNCGAIAVFERAGDEHLNRAGRGSFILPPPEGVLAPRQQFPSLEGLAHLAMCCKQSVVTALADLERLGFLTRIRRIRRITTPLGLTTRPITNAYVVHEPTCGLGLVAMTLFATESNSWTASEAKFSFLNQ